MGNSFFLILAMAQANRASGNLMKWFEFLIIGIALLILLYALISFIYRPLKGEPFWPNLKKAINTLIEAFSGVG